MSHPDLTDDDKITAYGRLKEVASQLDRRFARSIENVAGLSSQYFEVLLRLSRSPNSRLTMSELARQMDMSSGGVTRLVDRMSESDLAARTACSEDRRVSWVELTDDGRQMLDRTLPTHLADLEREFTDRLTADDLATLSRILDVLRDTPRDDERT